MSNSLQSSFFNHVSHQSDFNLLSNPMICSSILQLIWFVCYLSIHSRRQSINTYEFVSDLSTLDPLIVLCGPSISNSPNRHDNVINVTSVILLIHSLFCRWIIIVQVKFITALIYLFQSLYLSQFTQSFVHVCFGYVFGCSVDLYLAFFVYPSTFIRSSVDPFI